MKTNKATDTPQKAKDLPIFQSPEDALLATDSFYKEATGFGYSDEYVKSWIAKHIKLPKNATVLDLCCGDGIWSKGFELNNPNLNLHGIDISSGAIDKARTLLPKFKDNFVVGDTESNLPYPNGHFDIIFARGPGLYNQHSMDRDSSISVIEMWHEKLKDNGLFYSIFSSKPELMGTYTPMEESVLPYNRSPRKTEAVEFSGGKYHHSIESFLKPFWKAKNVKVINYMFFTNLHFLVTTKKPI